MNMTAPIDISPSFEKSAKPLLLALSPSRCWLFFLLSLHVLAIIATWIAAIGIAWKLPIGIGLCASLILYMAAIFTQMHGRRSGNRWFVDREQSVSELVSVDFISRWLVILSLNNTDRRRQRNRQYIIPFDAVDADSFRLLRVRLRIEGYELLNPATEEIK